MKIDQATRLEVIEAVIANLNQRYVFPEKAAIMEKQDTALAGPGLRLSRVDARIPDLSHTVVGVSAGQGWGS